MSETLHASPTLHITSFCGPASTDEPTRLRLQIASDPGDADVTFGFRDVEILYRITGTWLRRERKKLRKRGDERLYRKSKAGEL